MPFPDGWPPAPPSGVRSLRFFASGTATADFEDNAFLFGDTLAKSQVDPAPEVAPGAGVSTGEPDTNIGSLARPAPPLGGGVGSPVGSVPQTARVPNRAAQNIRIYNDSAGVLEFTFNDADGVHGQLLANEVVTYRNRYESGIAVRGAGLDFRIEAW